MRTLAIGDIHGCLTALESLLTAIKPRPQDTVITLGDYVDRGPDSKGVIQLLRSLHKRCQHIHLGGNHELMMLEARHSPDVMKSWLGFGGKETIASYGKTLEDVPEPHWDFISTARAYYETDTHFFVHANAHPERPIAKQDEEWLFWRPFARQAPHESGKPMICGHTAQRSGIPRNFGHAVCIDTCIYGDGWLTALEVETGEFWQANQQGDRRSANLAEILEADGD